MKKPKVQRLVVQHMEKVSGDILEEYPDVIREFIRKKGGVYALYKKGQLYYVGLAINLMARLKIHLRDRHRGAWDRFSVYSHIKELESMLIRIVGPKGNKLGGRFVKSQNLLLYLHRTMSEADADRRATLIGGYVALRRRRAKGKKPRGAGALHGLAGAPPCAPRLPRKEAVPGFSSQGWAHQLQEQALRYPKLGGARGLGEASKRLSFWRFKDSKREWVPLKNLKR